MVRPSCPRPIVGLMINNIVNINIKLLLFIMMMLMSTVLGRLRRGGFNLDIKGGGGFSTLRGGYSRNKVGDHGVKQHITALLTHEIHPGHRSRQLQNSTLPYMSLARARPPYNWRRRRLHQMGGLAMLHKFEPRRGGPRNALVTLAWGGGGRRARRRLRQWRPPSSTRRRRQCRT